MALDIATGSVIAATTKVVKGVVNSKVALVQVFGTYTGVTFVLEGSDDGTNFAALSAIDNGLLTLVTGTITPGTNGKNTWAVSTAGLTHIQLRATAWSTGTMSVIITESDNSFLGNGLPITSIIGNATAANLTAATASSSLLTTFPGEWVVTHAPLVNVKATTTKAAGAAGVRHVCTAISFTLTQSATGGTPFTGIVNLIDGASGGTPIATWSIAVPTAACSNSNFNLSGLNIFGTAATAMCLEYAAAGGAQTLETVTLVGYDVI